MSTVVFQDTGVSNFRNDQFGQAVFKFSFFRVHPFPSPQLPSSQEKVSTYICGSLIEYLNLLFSILFLIPFARI